MELYIGGMAQGKLGYVRTNYAGELQENEIADGAVCSEEELFQAKIINHFHSYIKRELEMKTDVYALVEQLLEKNPNVTIICDEVGAGIVPMKPEEREYRELVGRICCILAKKATLVERIICGIGVQLKVAGENK